MSSTKVITTDNICVSVPGNVDKKPILEKMYYNSKGDDIGSTVENTPLFRVVIKYKSIETHTASITIFDFDKNQLEQNSTYFKSLDHKLDYVVVDLEHAYGEISRDDLQLLFDIGMKTHEFLTEPILDKLDINMSLCNTANITETNINTTSMLFNLDMVERMLKLNKYFGFSHFETAIQTDFFRYALILKHALLTKYTELFGISVVIKGSIKSINREKILADMDNYRSSIIIAHCMKNIFRLYKIATILGGLYPQVVISWMQNIQSNGNQYNHLQSDYFDIPQNICTIEQVTLDNEISILDQYLMYKSLLVTQQFFNLYDHIDKLLYETPNLADMFYTQPNQTLHRKHEMVVSLGLFKARFSAKTSGWFNDFDWTNAIISGGFVYGLLDADNMSLIGSSDIDIYVYGENTRIIHENMKRVLKFFADRCRLLDHYYIRRASVITMIIDNFNFDIQIIPVVAKSPEDIVSKFDFSYIKSFYDGTKVMTCLDALTSMKYKVAFYDRTTENKHNLHARIYKTIKKGFNIHNSDVFNDINPTQILSNNDYEMENRKSRIIQGCFKNVDSNDMGWLIKTLYKTDHVYVALQDVISACEESTDKIHNYLNDYAKSQSSHPNKCVKKDSKIQNSLNNYINSPSRHPNELVKKDSKIQNSLNNYINSPSRHSNKMLKMLSEIDDFSSCKLVARQPCHNIIMYDIVSDTFNVSQRYIITDFTIMKCSNNTILLKPSEQMMQQLVKLYCFSRTHNAEKNGLDSLTFMKSVNGIQCLRLDCTGYMKRNNITNMPTFINELYGEEQKVNKCIVNVYNWVLKQIHNRKNPYNAGIKMVVDFFAFTDI